ncbi:hypothetical protein [Haloflavibacter putidus]|uniref:Uncharacterized protein n=1 Tax=Haloflavibacter putidus TaxID=2576776 RepID=A0A507ZAS5_9FLAO|nr:hypothetical protein [Haloflavibacter putidus]TQD34866.1 hypothetical protein FKR84_11770 [Haloflavibacter putidus]
MLVNVSYNKPKLKNEINEAVGKAFSFKERLKLNGIGSGKLFITSSSISIHNLLILDSYLNTCGIELRPDGIIVSFRSLLETYALVIPYYKLNLYKGGASEYGIYRDHHFIKVKADRNSVHKFFKKLQNCKAQHWSSEQPER